MHLWYKFVKLQSLRSWKLATQRWSDDNTPSGFVYMDDLKMFEMCLQDQLQCKFEKCFSKDKKWHFAQWHIVLLFVQFAHVGYKWQRLHACWSLIVLFNRSADSSQGKLSSLTEVYMKSCDGMARIHKALLVQVIPLLVSFERSAESVRTQPQLGPTMNMENC